RPGAEAHVLNHAVLHAGGLRGTQQLYGRSELDRKRLLTKNMLSLVDCAKQRLEVEVVREAIVDDVHVRRIDELFEPATGATHVVALGQLADALGVAPVQRRLDIDNSTSVERQAALAQVRQGGEVRFAEAARAKHGYGELVLQAFISDLRRASRWAACRRRE